MDDVANTIYEIDRNTFYQYNGNYTFSDAFIYDDLNDEGLYLEIQGLGENNWTTLETSKIVFK